MKCPICKSDMAIRTSREGNKFYGCNKYPLCHHTESIRPPRQTIQQKNAEDLGVTLSGIAGSEVTCSLTGCNVTIHTEVWDRNMLLAFAALAKKVALVPPWADLSVKFCVPLESMEVIERG